MDGLAADTPLGCKLLVHNVDVRRGLLLLHSRNCLVLGGGISALVKRQEQMEAKHGTREAAVDKERKRAVASAAAAAALVLSPPRDQQPAAPPRDATPRLGRPAAGAAAPGASAAAALDADIYAAQAAQRNSACVEDDELLAALLAEEEASGWTGEAAAGGRPAPQPPAHDDGWDDAALEAAIVAAELQSVGAVASAAAGVAAEEAASDSSDTFSPPARRPSQKRRRSESSATGSAVSWQSPQVLDVFSSPDGSSSKRPGPDSRTVRDEGGQTVQVRRQAVSTSHELDEVNLTQVLDLTARMDAAAAAGGGAAAAAGGGFQYDDDSDGDGGGAQQQPAPPRVSRAHAVVDVTCSDSDSSQQVSPPRRKPLQATSLLDSSVGSKITASASQSSTPAVTTSSTVPSDGWGQPQRFGASPAEPAGVKPLALLAARGSAAVGDTVFVRCICKDVVGSLQYQEQYSLQLLLADTTGTLSVHVAPALIQHCIGATPQALSTALGDKSATGKTKRKDAKGRVRQLATNLSRFVGWARVQRGSAPDGGWVVHDLKVCFNKQLAQLSETR